MSRLFYHVMQDNTGNLLFNVSGTMRLAGTGTLATIYGDEALTVVLPNPMTNHASFGSFKCFLGIGDYDFHMAKSGYTFETLTGVQGSGTMADQNASAVTLGTVTANGDVQLNSALLMNALVTPGAKVNLFYTKASQYGVAIRPSADSGTGCALMFTNAAGLFVGSIDTTATLTVYNTTSDSRLKHDVQDLTGELDAITSLRPVRWRWNADDSEGQGLLAGEVQAVVPGIITGTAGAVDEAGNIVPQMIDYSKLVPWLVGAIKTLAAQVAVLTEQVTACQAP